MKGRKMACFRLMANFAAAACLVCALFPSAARAQLPYDTWYVDRETGDMTVIQPLYVPKMTVDGSGMDRPLSSPEDLFIAANGHVFIADTGNDRIVELDASGHFVRSIGEEEGPGKLTRPEGVFVADDGTIYAANTGARTIVKYDADGRFLQAFGKPESDLLFDDYHFLPSKLVVDRRGVMYIVVKDTHQGLFRMNAKGEFTGFFGANKTKLSWLDRLQRAVLNRQQLSKLAPKWPNAIGNVALTDDGFLIVTSSGTVSDGQIRKLNPGGLDAFQNKAFDPQLVDTVPDAQGFLYTVSRRFGEIGIYDPTGELLALFGMSDTAARQLGVTGFPASIGVGADNDLWLLDSAQNLIQVFRLTNFGRTFMKANELHFRGEYEAAAPYWEEVIRNNGMMNVAFSGLGKYEMSRRNYGEALEYFKEARDSRGYSSAYWYIRYDWLQKYLVPVLAGAIALLWACSRLLRARRALAGKIGWQPLLKKYGTDLRDGLYVMFHPYEGYYRLKERKVSWTVIALVVAAAVAVNLYSVFGASLLAFPADPATVNIALRLGLLLVPWATWVIANYLVSAVKGGEGRFREIVQASAFALLPYIFMTVAMTLISHVLVYEEWVVMELMRQIMWIWIVVQFFVLTQVTHNFEFMETAKNIGITLFTICVIWIFAAIMIALGANLLDFIRQIYREVVFLA